MILQTPVEQAGRSYKMYARKLERLGIFTLQDFLYHIPSRYEDFSLVSKISQLQAGEQVTIEGTITAMKMQYLRNHKTLQQAKVADDSGEIEVVWFNQQFLPKMLLV